MTNSGTRPSILFENTGQLTDPGTGMALDVGSR